MGRERGMDRLWHVDLEVSLRRSRWGRGGTNGETGAGGPSAYVQSGQDG